MGLIPILSTKFAPEVLSVAFLASNQVGRVRFPSGAPGRMLEFVVIRVTGGERKVFDLYVADPNGQGPVCKSGTREFDSPPPLHSAPVVQRKGVGLLSREVAVQIRPGVPSLPA